ncbi:winged helix-turn-helix domain-containing protein [Methanosarcina vacuolata]|uniref:Uncharacterized protein n=1 Tax=Methanosarcina vacuolata Z-761 TaxID=1434123 RepID=A0A0E3Q2Y3_9EURY|nr:winged helix-turn-helix domain-containing protein [Methanosarcina vacuolata]AKB42793.1 hypothetical protein MSVAZ_0524 [Methanosarcina vacuolata Z-761]
MALQDFLGKTIEIKIIDFLAENPAFTYNQTEIAECVGISRQSVNSKLPELIYNGIIEIKEKHNNANCYQLAKNDIVRKLIGSVFENGLFVSEYENNESIVISDLKKAVGPIPHYEVIECFYYPNKTSELMFSERSPDIIDELEFPIKKLNGEKYIIDTVAASA